MSVNTSVPHPVDGFDAAHAPTPYFFVSEPMKIRSAPASKKATEQVQAGKQNDLYVLDPSITLKWFAASWETGTAAADAKVGDADRLYLLVGDEASDPWGWVCFYEEYKTKDPDETIEVHFGALTANNPPSQSEIDAAGVLLGKEKAARDAFLQSIGKTAGGDSVGKGGAAKIGAGVVLGGLAVGWLIYNASKK